MEILCRLLYLTLCPFFSDGADDHGDGVYVCLLFLEVHERQRTLPCDLKRERLHGDSPGQNCKCHVEVHHRQENRDQIQTVFQTFKPNDFLTHISSYICHNISLLCSIQKHRQPHSQLRTESYLFVRGRDIMSKNTMVIGSWASYIVSLANKIAEN